MITVSIDQILTNNNELSSLPASVSKLNELMQKDTVNISEISDVVASDPVLSARILKTVNSPFYGFPAKIETIAYAVTILGIDSIRYLALTSTVISRFSKRINTIFPLDSFWRHSFSTAIIAQQMAKKIHLPQHERLFTCGLLHELGGLLLAMSKPDIYRKVIIHANQHRLCMAEAEKQLLGFNHLDITSALLEQWQLPEAISETIKHTDRPVHIQPYVQDSAVLSIAEAVSSAIFPSMHLQNNDLKLQSQTMALAGINPSQLNQILDELDDLVDDAMDGLFMRPAAA